MLISILLATLLSSVFSLAVALWLTNQSRQRASLTVPLTALSSGVLLSTALLHLGPEAAHQGTPENAFLAIFAGILIFFMIERLVIWYHHHDDDQSIQPAAYLIAFGDTVHNFLDGVAIAAAFLVNPSLGILATTAIFLHEIPQEIADFNIMISKGFSVKRAVVINILSAAASLIGAIGTFWLDEKVTPVLPWLVGVSAGMFLYIALADLIPELHHHASLGKNRWIQLIWLFAGVGIIALLGVLIAHE